MIPTPPKAKKQPSAYDRGLRDSIEFGPIQSPFSPESKEAGEWADGIIQGRKNLVHNTRHAVITGMAARWVNESVSNDVGIQIGKSVLPLGAELAIYFRVGWILGACGINLPPGPHKWREFAKIVKMTMQGKALADMEVDVEDWLFRLANEQALLFVDRMMKGAFVPENKGRAPRLECKLADILAYMGGTYDAADWLPVGSAE